MPVYADVDDYVDYVGEPVPREIPPRIMARASLTIDKALVGAIYAVDDAGMPTDADLIAVFRDATCAQARPMVEEWESPAPVPPGCCAECGLIEESFDILRGAGLLPVGYLRMRG